jgi:hypothetical protein
VAEIAARQSHADYGAGDHPDWRKDHYRLGQLVLVRRLLGAWPK